MGKYVWLERPGDTGVQAVLFGLLAFELLQQERFCTRLVFQLHIFE